jgi:protein-tyrosine phosphatase
MSWINGIFGKGEAGGIPDMSALGVDMHSHLIPGIDDGAKTMEESLALIRQFAAMGYRKLITTPHINERFPNEEQQILDQLKLLKESVAKESIHIELEAAAEYLIEEAFEKRMKQGRLLTFGDNYLLLECSYYFPYPALSRVIYDLQTDGYNIILAHAERYAYWHDTFYEYEKLKNRDVYFQMNFSSLTGHYSNGVRRMARKLIESGWIEFAGSDVHNQDYFDLFNKGIHDKYGASLFNSGKLKNNLL